MRTFVMPCRSSIVARLIGLIVLTTHLHAAEVRISTAAIERVIAAQFFSTAHQRHYLSGDEIASATTHTLKARERRHAMGASS
jgi:hypothetical protein